MLNQLLVEAPWLVQITYKEIALSQTLWMRFDDLLLSLCSVCVSQTCVWLERINS